MVSDRHVCVIQWSPHNQDLQSRKYAVAYFKVSIFYVTEFETKAQPTLVKYYINNLLVYLFVRVICINLVW